MAWAEFTGAFISFFLSHSIPVRPPVRLVLERYLGPRGFTFAYSALSLALLAWLIGAAARAPFVPIWGWAPWQSHVVLVAMAVVCGQLAFAIGTPNPFSFGGARNDRFDPQAPGIVRLFRHPLLAALCLWAFAHAVPNGDLAHVILFAVFGVFAVAGHRLIDRRKQRQMGAAWTNLWRQTRDAPITFSIASGLRLAAAVVLYLFLIWLHPLLFGVTPLPLFAN